MKLIDENKKASQNLVNVVQHLENCEQVKNMYEQYLFKAKIQKKRINKWVKLNYKNSMEVIKNLILEASMLEENILNQNDNLEVGYDDMNLNQIEQRLQNCKNMQEDYKKQSRHLRADNNNMANVYASLVSANTKQLDKLKALKEQILQKQQ